MVARTIVSPPSVEPISVAEAKTHLRIVESNTDDDTYIGLLITAVRRETENFLGRALITQTWDAYWSKFPASKDYIDLPLPPLQSVTGVYYTDSDGTENTMSATEYDVDTDSIPGRVVLKYGEQWPTATLQPMNPVRIRFICGHGDASTDVPEHFVAAMQLQIADLYDIRGSINIGNIVNKIPVVQRLLWTDRVVTR